jgi:AcrR family transcriptional regulator
MPISSKTPTPATRRPSRNAAAKAAPASPWRGASKARGNRELKREALIRAAARAFNDQGFHNTSLDDIAAALEVTKPTIYYYVRNKEELLFQCFLTGLEGIRNAFLEVAKSPAPARERLAIVLRGYAVAIASEFGWCMVRVEDQDLGPQMSSHIKALKSEIDHGIRDLLAAGVRDGSIAVEDPKMTAFAMAGALNWIAHWYRDNRPMSAAQISDMFVHIFERGYLPRRSDAE